MEDLREKIRSYLLVTVAKHKYFYMSLIPKLSVVIAPFFHSGLFPSSPEHCHNGFGDISHEDGSDQESWGKDSVRDILPHPCEFTVAPSDAMKYNLRAMIHNFGAFTNCRLSTY